MILIELYIKTKHNMEKNNASDCNGDCKDRYNEDNEIKIEIRIVKQVTDREECIDMVLGTNLIQGSELKDGDLVDLVVGIKKMQLPNH